MLEKTSRCQTAVVFRLVSPIIPYVCHLNPNQCGRQNSSDDINSFINLKFYSYSKNRNRKSGDSLEYTTVKSTVYLLSFIKNGLPNPSFVFFISPALFHRWNECTNEKSFWIIGCLRLIYTLIIWGINCIEWLLLSTINNSVEQILHQCLWRLLSVSQTTGKLSVWPNTIQ